MSKSKKVRKKNNNLKRDMRLTDGILKDMAICCVRGVGENGKGEYGFFSIRLADLNLPRPTQLDAIRRMTFYWQIDCSVLLRYEDGTEDIISHSVVTKSRYYQNSKGLLKEMNDLHSQILKDEEINPDDFITVGWIAMPNHQDELSMDKVMSMYQKMRGFELLSKREADAREAEKVA